MTRWVQRAVFAFAGGAIGAELVALVEARAIASSLAGSRALRYVDLAAADAGVLVPLALAIAAGVASFCLFLEPERALTLDEHIDRIRAEPVLARSRTAAVAPLLVFTTFAWCTATAHAARVILASSAPIVSGVKLAIAAFVIVGLLAPIGLALLPPLRRVLAAGARAHPRLLDPVSTFGVSLVAVAILLAYGIATGDTGGDGGGALGVFGVLKRDELDLRPLVNLVAIAGCAYMAPIALSQSPRLAVRTALATLIAFAPIALTIRAAHALNEAPSIARAIERGAPLGKIALGIARRATDRDHDGASPYFGGGDCDDNDARRRPTAVDIPGNGIDEDCSGSDLAPALALPIVREGKQPLDPQEKPWPADLNVIVVTIDTLRTDVGFMGYTKPTTPNLDRLALRATVFERAYAMASYTGKSVGPLLIGKYPGETLRDGGHFNKYEPGNTFVAERLRAAKIHTFGAASHWYFAPWSGLTQGMEAWDLSAKPRDGQGDNDTSVTSAQLSDAAIRLLAKPEHTSGRFFMWIHYFDPHAQYMPHPGAPDFLGGARGGVAASKAAYDAEVWFADKQLGRVIDYVAAQPWGARTAIVVTSDHGETFGEHNMSWHGVEIWEPLVRVPIVIYVPGVTPHRVSPKRSQVDLVPTVLDLFGVALPDRPAISGSSLARDLLNASGPFDERDVYIDMPPGPYTQMRRAVITGSTPGMKLVHLGGAQYQLFDLAADPDEQDDLAADKLRMEPVLAALLRKRAELHEIEVKPDTPPPP